MLLVLTFEIHGLFESHLVQLVDCPEYPFPRVIFTPLEMQERTHIVTIKRKMLIQNLNDLLLIAILDAMVLHKKVVFAGGEEQGFRIDLSDAISGEEVSNLTQLDGIHYFKLLTIFLIIRPFIDQSELEYDCKSAQ
jgi:hypothetical protein